MRSQWTRVFLVAAGATAAAGCGLFSEVACDAQALPAIVVTVRDSLSGQPLGGGARVIAREGALADTADYGDGAQGYPLAFERAGTYTVTVEQDGYRLWTRSGVRARRDECHVRTVRLTALLQR